jgi:hypothetical protein
VFFILFTWFINNPKIVSKLLRKLPYFSPFIIFAFLNMFHSESRLLVSLKWLKAFEFCLLGLYVFSNNFSLKFIAKPLSTSVIYTSLISISQMFLQKSLGGPFYWLGERAFTARTPSIALFNFLGRQYLRPYATFPHPNALAGFMLLSLLVFFFTRPKSLLVKTAIFFAALSIAISFSRTIWVTSLILLIFYAFKKIFFNPVFSSLLFILLVTFSVLLPVISLHVLTAKVPGNLALEQRLELSAESGFIF